MLRKIFSVSAIVFIFGYLWIGRGHWYSELERQAAVGDDPLYSEVLDLSQTGKTNWRIPKNGWSYTRGEAKLSLIFDKAPGLPPDARDRSKIALRLTVSSNGIDKHGISTDRLIRNWYYTTSEPFDPRAKLWSSGDSGTIEHGLAGIIIYPFEETIVTIDVTTPDGSLLIGKPRLKLVGEFDYAVYGVLPLLRFLRDAGLIVACILVLCLAYMSLRSKHVPNHET